jgi:hypothetical protein
VINHAYTLLLNSKKPTDVPPWDRYIDAEFNPLKLSSSLATVRDALVGTGGWWDLTFRAEQLLKIIKFKTFNGKYDWMDKRETLPAVSPFVYSAKFLTTTPDGGVTNMLSGYERVAYSGRVNIHRKWRVRSSGSTKIAITDQDGALTEAQVLGNIAPVSQDIRLVFTGPLLPESGWNLVSFVSPSNEFMRYTRVASLTSGVLAQLFYMAMPEDEILSEYNRWYTDANYPEEQVAAVVLAYVFQASKLI